MIREKKKMDTIGQDELDSGLYLRSMLNILT